MVGATSGIYKITNIINGHCYIGSETSHLGNISSKETKNKISESIKNHWKQRKLKTQQKEIEMVSEKKDIKKDEKKPFPFKKKDDGKGKGKKEKDKGCK